MYRLQSHRPGTTYRTVSGQTGRSAYVYELAAIANARRALDQEMSKLIDIITAELPEDFTTNPPLGDTGFCPEVPRENAVSMLNMCRLADEFSTDSAMELIKYSNLKGD